MQTVQIIKRQLTQIYNTNPVIHITMPLSRGLQNSSSKRVRLAGVYRNIFVVQESINGIKKTHTLQYSDVLTNEIEIKELIIKKDNEN